MSKMWLMLLWLAVLAWFPPAVHAEPARWNLDPEHSTIEFRITHMVVSKTTGQFTDYAGYIDMDAEDGTVTAIEATIPIIVTTMRSSISEKPALLWRCIYLPVLA